MNGLSFKVIAEGEVAQHLEVGAVTCSLTYILNITCTDTFLAGTYSCSRRNLCTCKIWFQRSHTCIDQQKTLISLWYQGKAFHYQMSFALHDTLYTMTEILADELGKEGGPKGVRLVALSGPTHAEEVAIDLPTTIVSASKDMEAAAYVQEVFTNNVMRVYTNEDIKGVELSGAMKNVIALGVGISTGLGYGDNARAALITRGIAEIARLGVAMGCNVHTFAGLAGIGDLIVTATSMHSRNNRAGILIGKGETPENAVKEVGMVVEGMNALPAALELAERYQVEMPIVQTVNAIVNKGMSAAEAVKSLMERGLKNELPQGYEK